jgi:hypothetical protein
VGLWRRKERKKFFWLIWNKNDGQIRNEKTGKTSAVKEENIESVLES